MKKVITAIAFMFVISANVSMASEHEDEHDGYNQHESRDHGDRDRYEHGDSEHGDHDKHERSDNEGSDHNRHEHSDSHRGEHHTVNREDNQSSHGTEAGGRIMPDWWPF